MCMYINITSYAYYSIYKGIKLDGLNFPVYTKISYNSTELNESKALHPTRLTLDVWLHMESF